MLTQPEIQRFLSAQPLHRMRQFAAMLGWRGLRLSYVLLTDEEAIRARIANGIIFYYMTSDEKFNLQINTQPFDQFRNHRGTVKAERYGIVHVHFHEFELFDDDNLLRQEAQRLLPWLGRANFKDRNWRRRIAHEHPEIPHTRLWHSKYRRNWSRDRAERVPEKFGEIFDEP